MIRARKYISYYIAGELHSSERIMKAYYWFSWGTLLGDYAD